jgi:hypothetical protein
LVRVRDPEGDQYAIWEGYVMIPLARFGWVIAIQALDRGILVAGAMFGRDEDVPTTGVREALAFHAWSHANPEQSIDHRIAGFDPYDRRWDDLVPGDHLSTVRNYLDRLQTSVHCRPEFNDQAPFRPATGHSKVD